MIEFMGIAEERVVQIRKPVADAMALASGHALIPAAHDDTVSPGELVAAMIDANALGLASSINAAIKNGEAPRNLLDQALARVRLHVERMLGRG